MKSHPSRKPQKERKWPHKVRCGRVTVSVYCRKTLAGNPAFMVANYANGKRLFDCYATEEKALEEANILARKLSKLDVVAASLTNEQAADYAAAVEALAPFNLSLVATAGTVADCLKLVGDLPGLQAAAKFYAAHNKVITRKRVPDVVAEMLKVKQLHGASARYLQDLRFRLNHFANDFCKDACDVTTAEIQAWLDAKKLAQRSYMNFRQVIHALFEFAVARAYAMDNPVAAVESVDVRGGEVEIFTPAEITRLLAAASPEFLPCLAIDAFAGLRSTEIERLEWSDVDLVGRHITIGASKAKTASRRIVPISDNLAAWLAPYARRKGNIWPGEHDAFYEAQQETAAATAVEAEPEKDIKAQARVKWRPTLCATLTQAIG